MSAGVAIRPDQFDATLAVAGPPVLVEFWFTWCKPSKLVGPILMDLVSSHTGRLRIVNVDVDDEGGRDLARRLGVKETPTLILFDGTVERMRSAGFIEKVDLLAMVEPFLTPVR